MFHHVCFTVSDIERSIQFYQDIFGMRLTDGPRDVGGEGTSTPSYTSLTGARLKLALLQLDGDYFLELIQYLYPEGKKTVATRLCDVGSAHIAFSRDDITKFCEALKTKGVSFVADPAPNSKGLLMAYFYDPDGFVLEVIERQKRNDYDLPPLAVPPVKS